MQTLVNLYQIFGSGREHKISLFEMLLVHCLAGGVKSLFGGDVTYLVNYFRSQPCCPSCLLQGFFCAADINGDCSVIGGDVTRLVNYFRGRADILNCPDYPPAWPTMDDLPVDPPAGWPNCE